MGGKSWEKEKMGRKQLPRVISYFVIDCSSVFGHSFVPGCHAVPSDESSRLYWRINWTLINLFNGILFSIHERTSWNMNGFDWRIKGILGLWVSKVKQENDVIQNCRKMFETKVIRGPFSARPLSGRKEAINLLKKDFRTRVGRERQDESKEKERMEGIVNIWIESLYNCTRRKP